MMFYDIECKKCVGLKKKVSDKKKKFDKSKSGMIVEDVAKKLKLSFGMGK